MSPTTRYALPFTLSTTLLLALGCGGRGASSGGDGSSSSWAAGLTLQTTVDHTEVTAGGRVQARCTIHGSSGVGAQPVLTLATEPLLAVDREGDAFVLSPTKARAYHVACRSQDGALRDPNGVNVRVLPGPPVQAETYLSATQVRAAVPVSVDCRAVDAYDNEVVSSEIVTVGVADSLQTDGTSVWGTTAGEYAVSCQVGALRDPTAALLQVLPGPAATSETRVEPTQAGPREQVAVFCEVRDGYGNEVHDAEAVFSVMADNGAGPLQTGLVTDARGFSVTRAGTYLVFCSVPGHDAGDVTPAEAEIGAGLPYNLFVDFGDLGCYEQGQLLPLSYFVYDFWDNLVDLSGAELTTHPAGSLVADGLGGYTFAVDGDVDIALTVPGPHHPEAAIEPFVATLRVDSVGPAISIASPGRGSMVEAGDTSEMELTITAEVQDAVSPITTVVLEDELYEADEAPMHVTLTATHRSRWGLNTLTGLAVDACGNRAPLAQSYLRSPTYQEPTTEANERGRVRDALVMVVDEEVLDDGWRRTSTTWQQSSTRPSAASISTEPLGPPDGAPGRQRRWAPH